MENKKHITQMGSIRVGDKYEMLTFEDARHMRERPREIDGKTLYTIRALKDFGNVKKGDLGGYIESPECLSAEGNCWISKNSVVHAGSTVSDNAILIGNIELRGKTTVSDNAILSGRIVAENCIFQHNSCVHGQLMLMNCRTSGSATIKGDGATVHTVAEFASKFVVNGFHAEQVS